MGGLFDVDVEVYFDEVVEVFVKFINVDCDVGVDLEKELCMMVEVDDCLDVFVVRCLLLCVLWCILLVV